MTTTENKTFECRDTTNVTQEHIEPVQHFKNMYGELDYYKKKCEILEKDLAKMQAQNKKLEGIVKQLQDINAANSKSMNNTSSTYLLPSEFKTVWETYIKDLLLNSFESFIDSYHWLSHLSQDTLKIVYEESNTYISDIIKGLLKFLKITNVESNESFLPRFRSLFQEHFISIFSYDDDFLQIVKRKLKERCKHYKDFEDKIDDLNYDIETSQFKAMVQTLFKLCTYMLLHDPVLTINIQPYETRSIIYHYYNKSDFINIEGFAKENCCCAVIVFPPILRKNFYFQGIKPAVYIIDSASENIIQECEKNKAMLWKGRSNSITDPSLTSLKVSKKLDLLNNIENSFSKKESKEREKEREESSIVKGKEKETDIKSKTGTLVNSNTANTSISLSEKKEKKKPLNSHIQKLNNLKEKITASNKEIEEETLNTFHGNSSNTQENILTLTQGHITVSKYKDKDKSKPPFELPKKTKKAETINHEQTENNVFSNNLKESFSTNPPKTPSYGAENKLNYRKIDNRDHYKEKDRDLQNTTNITNQQSNPSRTPRTNVERLETENNRDYSEVSGLHDISDLNMNENYKQINLREKVLNKIPKKSESSKPFLLENDIGSRTLDKNTFNEEVIRRKIHERADDNSYSPGLYNAKKKEKMNDNSFYKNSSMYDYKNDRERLDKPSGDEKYTKYTKLVQNSKNVPYSTLTNPTGNNPNSSYLGRKNSHASELNTSETSIKISKEKSNGKDILGPSGQSKTIYTKTNNDQLFSGLGETNIANKTYNEYLKSKKLSNDNPSSVNGVGTGTYDKYTGTYDTYSAKLNSGVISSTISPGIAGHKKEITHTPSKQFKLHDSEKEEYSHNSYLTKEEYSSRRNENYNYKSPIEQQDLPTAHDIYPSKDGFVDRIMRNREKGRSKERVYEYVYNNNEQMNTSQTKNVQADIKNKIDNKIEKYYYKRVNANTSTGNAATGTNSPRKQGTSIVSSNTFLGPKSKEASSSSTSTLKKTKK